MKNLKLQSCYALASAAVIGIAACSGGDSSANLAPTGPAFDVTVSAHIGEVCKSGPAGTYNFDLVFGGSSNTGDVKATSPASITITDPAVTECVTVFTRTQYAGGTSDPAASIQITEQAAPGTGLQDITAVDGAAASNIDEANRRATIYVNAFHSAKATFVNVPLGGCTFTQGWYKNHTSQWPAGAYTPNTVFDGWLTWINLYNTPPKGGNQYIILAHQYMTALLNIQGGASAPQAVLDAIATATTYFNGGGVGTGGNTNISGLAAILDDYNNGVTGPGHCD